MIQRVGKVAYKLELPQDSLIHPVFHLSQLKPYTSDYTPVYDRLLVLIDLEAVATVPLEIIEHRMVKKGNTAIPQVKLQWKGLPSTATSWEDYYVIKKRFPSAPARGQAVTQAGGAVTPGAQG